MLTEKEERRTKHVVRRMLERQKGRRENEPGKARPRSFSLGWGSGVRAKTGFTEAFCSCHPT